MRVLLWGLVLAPLAPAVLVPAVIAIWPTLVWNFFVPKVPYYWRLVKYLEFANPAQPAAHTQLFAPGYRRCFAAKVASAEDNCGGKGCGLVFVGDSILEDLTGVQCYWGLLGPRKARVFQEAAPAEWRPLIVAGGSDQTQHTLNQLPPVLRGLKSPRAFFIMIGTNNVGFSSVAARPRGGQTVAQIAGGILAVAEGVRKSHPESQVLLHALLPRTDDLGYLGFQRLIDEVNVALQAFAESAGPRVTYLDCGKVFVRGASREARQLMPDLLHPNPEGYRRWLACLRPAFARVMGVAET